MAKYSEAALAAYVAADATANAMATADEVLTWLQGADPAPPLKTVSWAELMKWAVPTGIIARVETEAAANASDTVKSACRALLTVMTTGKDLDLSDSGVQGLVSIVVPAVITTAERDSLYATSRGTPSRLEVQGWPVDLSVHDVARATGKPEAV